MATHTARECLRLRAIAIGRLGVEDLRLLIGQRIGLPWLLPLAVERLEDEPLAEGDFYPGDLLVAVLRVPDGEWTRSDGLTMRVRRIVGAIEDVPDEIAGEVREWLNRWPVS